MRFLFCTFTLLWLQLTIFASNFSWEKLDNINEDYVKAILSGDYESAFKELKQYKDTDDANKLYNLGLLYDEYSLYEFCHNCGHCPTCKPGNILNLPEPFDFSRKKAMKYYKKAHAKGHPYAGFKMNMIQRASGKTKIDTFVLKMMITKLDNYIEQNDDAVAKFMYHYLESELVLRPDSSSKLTEKYKRIISDTIAALEAEAREGRNLAMYYLGITHRLQQDHEKAFAWFYIASKRGHYLSGAYAQDTLSKLDTEENKAKAVNYLKGVIATTSS